MSPARHNHGLLDDPLDIKTTTPHIRLTTMGTTNPSLHSNHTSLPRTRTQPQILPPRFEETVGHQLSEATNTSHASVSTSPKPQILLQDLVPLVPSRASPVTSKLIRRTRMLNSQLEVLPAKVRFPLKRVAMERQAWEVVLVILTVSFPFRIK